MKKIISLLLIVFETFGLIACGDVNQNEIVNENPIIEETDKELDVIETTMESEPSEQLPNSSSSEKRVLVAYFSVTGNTKIVAEKIAAVACADIYEIKPTIEYTDADINYGDSNSRSSKEQNDSSVRPEIRGETVPLEEYDTIYIGYPIWWGEEPRIMDTFVENYNFGNITMIPFCTSGSSSIGNSGKNLAANAGSGNWLEGKRFDAGVSEGEIKDWIENTLPDNKETEDTGMLNKIKVEIGSYTFSATLEENAAVDELIVMMKQAPIVLELDDYSGFEKVGPLGKTLTRSDEQTTTEKGDIVLYNGSNIVIFYGSNSWSYTRIGRIDDLSDWDKALGNGSVKAIFSID